MGPAAMMSGLTPLHVAQHARPLHQIRPVTLARWRAPATRIRSRPGRTRSGGDAGPPDWQTHCRAYAECLAFRRPYHLSYRLLFQTIASYLFRVIERHERTVLFDCLPWMLLRRLVDTPFRSV